MKPHEEGGCASDAKRLAQHLDRGAAKPRRPIRLTEVEAEQRVERMSQNTGLIDDGARAPVIISRRPPGRNSDRGCNAHNRLVEDAVGRARRTLHSRGPQESNGVIRGTLKGRELDALLMRADHRGVYKRFLVWGWLVPVCLLVPCAHLNILLMVYLPPSNCTLPTPPPYLSHEDWRSLATPKTPTGELDSCALYDFSAALKDRQYDPGADDTHITLDPGTSTAHPSTSQDRSTPRGDTSTLEYVPDTTRTEKDTGTLEDVPGFSEHSYTLEKDTSSPREDPSTPEKPGIEQHHPNTSGPTSAPEYTYSLDPGTSRDISAPKHTRAQEQHSSTPEDPITQEQQMGTQERHRNTQEQDSNTQEQGSNTSAEGSNTSEQHMPTHGQTHTSYTNDSPSTQHDLAKSRVARYFDPFDDLFVPKKELEGDQAQPKRKQNPMEEYLKAAITWQRQYPKEPPPSNYTMGCVFGYDFDKTYVQESLSMRFGWACDAAQGITHILRVSMVGNVIGCILFGALADRAGRKWVFMVLAVKVAVLGSFFVLVRGSWSLLVLRFLLALGLPAIYQVMIITALEQVRDGERGLVTSLSSVCFSLGQCLLALLAWLTGNWISLGLVTSLPAILALVYARLVEESPLWLVSRGREMEAALVLQRVTIRNNMKHQPKPSLFLLRARIREITTAGGDEWVMGIQDICRGACGWVIGAANFLVTYPYLSFRVVLVTICWTVNHLLYFVTTMKYPYVTENPYLGWFCTSVTEVPANLLMPLLLRYLGRRVLHSVGLVVCSSAFLTSAALLAAGYKENFLAVSVLVLVVKFCSSMTYLVVYLQAAELHPTPIRSFVTGLASLVALTVNIFSPSILSVPDPFYAHLLLGLLGLAGTLSAFLLPETAGRPLPQTLQEAENFTWRNKTNTSIVPPAQEEDGRVMEEREALRDTGGVPPPAVRPRTSFHRFVREESSVL